MGTPEGQPQPIEGQSRIGVITDIQPACQLGSDGNFPVAIIGCPEGENWIPLPEDSGLNIDDSVTVTPITTQVGKGSSTTYRVEKDPSKE